jgi:hypothetical protein
LAEASAFAGGADQLRRSHDITNDIIRWIPMDEPAVVEFARLQGSFDEPERTRTSTGPPPAPPLATSRPATKVARLRMCRDFLSRSVWVRMFASLC